MAKVSVIVPVYNVEAYLEECLNSLVNQTLKDIEIICVNDGSTDSSLAIVEEFAAKDRRIKIINKPNSGLGATMNAGFNAATSDYVGILESDDFAGIEMFEELYEVALKHDADIVVSDFYRYWTKSKKMKKANRTSKYKLNAPINCKTFPSLLRNRTTVWSCLYKRELLEKYNIRYLETPGASYQDTGFRIKTLVAADKVVAVKKAYVRYRQDNLNSSVKQKDKVYYIRDEYSSIFDFLNKYPEFKLRGLNETLINKWSGYIWNLGRISDEFVDEFLDVFYLEFKQHYENKELSNYFYRVIGKYKLLLLIKNKATFKTYVRKLKGKSTIMKALLFVKLALNIR